VRACSRRTYCSASAVIGHDAERDQVVENIGVGVVVQQHQLDVRATQIIDQAPLRDDSHREVGMQRDDPLGRDRSERRDLGQRLGLRRIVRVGGDADHFVAGADGVQVLGDRRHQRDDPLHRTVHTSTVLVAVYEARPHAANATSTASAPSARTRKITAERYAGTPITPRRRRGRSRAREAGVNPARSRPLSAGAAARHGPQDWKAPARGYDPESQDTVARTAQHPPSRQGKDPMLVRNYAALCAALSILCGAPAAAKQRPRPPLAPALRRCPRSAARKPPIVATNRSAMR